MNIVPGISRNVKNREALDFGLLKIRKTKIKPAEANVLRTDYSQIATMKSYSNERFIESLKKGDASQVRQISKYFFTNNGIYARAVRYLADMYRYDYMIYPNIDLDAEMKEQERKQLLKKFNDVLYYFDNSDLQILFRRWSTEVCVNGVYYGYICQDEKDKLVVQDLPVDYCRSQFKHKGLPLVEFNAKYFDKVTNNITVRERLLSLFPDEFKANYKKYQDGKLQREVSEDDDGWFLLDPNCAFKFSFNDTDKPPLVNSIPSIINLGEVQDLTKEKLVQTLQKILVQHFALDANGQIPFEMNELQQLNQNALDMIGDTLGVAVLSTVADVSMHDVGESSTDPTTEVATAESNVYNDLGISNNLFNTDGNIALEKSIAVDEGFMKPLLLQFESFVNRYLNLKFNNNKYKFRFKMLLTTIFNYKDLSSTYKELTKIGFSRFLPMTCLGHSQKEVISMAKLEQDILSLDNYMLPPFSSNTMSSDTWAQVKSLQAGIVNEDNLTKVSADDMTDKQNGRPTLEPDKKTDKTIANEAAKG